MKSAGGSLRFRATNEISIGVEMWLTIFEPVTSPPDEPMALRVEDVSNQALEFAIALCRPFGGVLG